MSGFTIQDGRELAKIRRALEDIRDLYAASLELGTETPAPRALTTLVQPVSDGPIPGQMPLEACEHRIGDHCAIGFGGTSCATCPTPIAAP